MHTTRLIIATCLTHKHTQSQHCCTNNPKSGSTPIAKYRISTTMIMVVVAMIITYDYYFDYCSLLAARNHRNNDHSSNQQWETPHKTKGAAQLPSRRAAVQNQRASFLQRANSHLHVRNRQSIKRKVYNLNYNANNNHSLLNKPHVYASVSVFHSQSQLFLL